MADVRLEGVTKYFGDTRVLEDLDLEIGDGEFAVVLGPSGCGKSTLLRLIAGVETLTAGAIVIDSEDVARVHPGRRDVAMVFQDYALYPHMTVEKNLSFGMRARRAGPKPEILARVHDVASALQIDDLLNRKPAQLSGGQRQRVALGRAMMRSPRAYLMDEPLSNLDAALRVQVREDLIRFHRDIGGTILYVTHDQIEAMTMGERVIVMHDGTIQQNAPPGDIYDRPANLFVATFVGSPRMNTIDALVTHHDHSATVTADDLVWHFDDAGGTLPDKVVAGFRPEAVVPADGSQNMNTDAAIAVREIDLSEHIGHEALLRLGTTGNSLLARVPAALARTLPHKTGYRIARSDVHLFDPETGIALCHGDAPHSSSDNPPGVSDEIELSRPRSG